MDAAPVMLLATALYPPLSFMWNIADYTVTQPMHADIIVQEYKQDITGITKAFDTVPHRCPLYKADWYGIWGNQNDLSMLF